jgi:hypothetical protein
MASVEWLPETTKFTKSAKFARVPVFAFLLSNLGFLWLFAVPNEQATDWMVEPEGLRKISYLGGLPNPRCNSGMLHLCRTARSASSQILMGSLLSTESCPARQSARHHVEPGQAQISRPSYPAAGCCQKRVTPTAKAVSAKKCLSSRAIEVRTAARTASVVRSAKPIRWRWQCVPHHAGRLKTSCAGAVELSSSTI